MRTTSENLRVFTSRWATDGVALSFMIMSFSRRDTASGRCELSKGAKSDMSYHIASKFGTRHEWIGM